jgi:hypothetical protein
MVEDLIKRLRERATVASVLGEHANAALFADSADLLEQQATRLTALESERDALLAAAGKEAVAWQVRRADGRIDGVPIQWENCTQELYDATLATGRYAGYENGPQCEVRALYTAPTAALEKSSDALYTMDQMRDCALAFHKSRLDARGDLTAKQKWDIAERVHSQCEALKPHATFRSAASQAINDTIAALSQKAGEQQ